MNSSRWGTSGIWAFMALALMALATYPLGARQAKQFPLETTAGLRLHNVAAAPATLQGRKGVRVTVSDEAVARLKAMPPDDQTRQEFLASVDGIEFGDGTIEVEVAGEPAAAAGEGARGFAGIAFRVQPDLRTYDCFYLRPTNGRAEDQERRNHSAQYISHPDWPWFRLRQETPSRYESYVDLQPATWTKIRVEVQGTRARLFVHDQPQPTLIVNDVKTGAQGRGGVALFIDPTTVAHFRNLSVLPTR